MPKYGAHAMSGAFATKWAALGGAAKIGWPRDDITVVTNSNGTGKYQTYSNAQIVWVQSKGTFRVYGAYLKAVQKAGGYDGYVGWPLGDVSGNNQQFQGGWVFYNDSFVDGIIREPSAYERWIDGAFSREFRSEVTVVGIPDRSLADPVIQRTIESLPKVSVLIVSCRKGEEVACETWVRRRFPRLSVEVRPDLIELDE